MTKPQFFWGASTAAHQVEGGTVNQWSVWELASATRLAKDAHNHLSGLPNWQTIKKQAENPANYVSGKGVDHFHRYKTDFAIAQKLNFNAFRFTVEWSRLEPEEGKWDIAAFKHYKEYISTLKEHDLEPFLNIWHWTMPTWFTDKGGFAKRKNLIYFDRLVKKISEELLDNVSYVITVNEANSYATFSYMQPKWPPEEHNIFKGAYVYFNLSSAHRRAYKIIKQINPAIHVGLAHQATLNLPFSEKNYLDKFAAWVSNYVWHIWFFNRAKKYQDFIGFNYYFTNYIKTFRARNPVKPINDLGWYMEPYAIRTLMTSLYKKYKKPLIITENGVADGGDIHRKWWIEESLRAIDDAKADGVDVRGYLHWSLLDNFEWADGWWPKFGLVAVDRENNMKRTVRPSAIWFAKELARRKRDIDA